MEDKVQKQRTSQQNRSLHKYCGELATELNNAGISMEILMKNIEADHTMESVKSLWRAFAKAKYGKTSTADLTTTEVTAIYDEVNRHIAQFGIHMAWPCEENTENYLNSFKQ